MRNAYKILVGKPEGKRLLGMPKRRWEDNILMDLTEIGSGGKKWITLAQDVGQCLTIVNTLINLRVP
jgi:hypothetical protein